MKSGNFNFLEFSGPLQACNGTDLPFNLPIPAPPNILQYCHTHTHTHIFTRTFPPTKLCFICPPRGITFSIPHFYPSSKKKSITNGLCLIYLYFCKTTPLEIILHRAWIATEEKKQFILNTFCFCFSVFFVFCFFIMTAFLNPVQTKRSCT